MAANTWFEQEVSAGKATGTVIAIDAFLITVKGLHGATSGAVVAFETGQRGLVREINGDHVTILNLDSTDCKIGGLAVLAQQELQIPVGEAYIGRVVDPFGRALDGKGTIQPEAGRPAFSQAPGIAERTMLSDQLPTGVSIIDSLFPVVLGQRIAVLGDSKSGKTSFMLQMATQQQNTGRVVVYVLIGKRRVEVDQVIGTLNQTGAMQHSIVVVANIFDSLAQSYIAPYAGCAMAEHLWHGGRDVVIAYDDLASHAKVYREISLLAKVNPGRESYPGDMFHAHSSLLERAGRLASNDKTLTALPIILTPGDDITAHLPTSIMSITDGQIIFDLASFRQNIRPAVNIGLSVSRVGGRAQNTRQKHLTSNLFKILTEYKKTLEFSHFTSEMTTQSRQLLALGQQIYDAFRQTPSQQFNLEEQLLLLETILRGTGASTLNVEVLKQKVREAIAGGADTGDATQNELLKQTAIQEVQ